MAGPLVIGAEGVILVQDKDSYASSRPVMEGIELVMMLRNFPTSRAVVLVSIEDTSPAEHFVKVHGLKEVGVVGIAAEDRIEEPPIAQWNAVQRQRSLGPVNLVLTAHQYVYERCTGTHQPVILFARRGALGALDARSSWEDLARRAEHSRDAKADAQ